MSGGWKTQYMALAGLLARRRKELGMTQRQLAVQLRAGCRTLQRWEAGRAMPPSARLFQWAAALEIEIAPHVAHSENGLTDSTVSHLRHVMGLSAA